MFPTHKYVSVKALVFREKPPDELIGTYLRGYTLCEDSSCAYRVSSQKPPLPHARSLCFIATIEAYAEWTFGRMGLFPYFYLTSFSDELRGFVSGVGVCFVERGLLSNALRFISESFRLIKDGSCIETVASLVEEVGLGFNKAYVYESSGKSCVVEVINA